VPAGDVISQSPVGRVLHRGDTVSLTVSRGPELVKVPGDLRAQGVQAAIDELAALGFRVRVVHSDFYLGLGYVASWSPGGGAMAPKGSTVVLKIV
jgi:serine/threonine-protein kinase